MFNFLKKLKKKPHNEAIKDAHVRDAFKAVYSSFRELLSENNRVLELMADMEEKLSGEYLFDRIYIDKSVKTLSEKVHIIVKNLNAISGGRYRALLPVFDEINAKIVKNLSPEIQIPVSDYTIPIEKLNSDMMNIAGGKMAHLGHIGGNTSLPVPAGFVITSHAFKKFFEHNDLTSKIKNSLSALNIEDLEELKLHCSRIRNVVLEAEIPPYIEESVLKSTNDLIMKAGLNSNSPVRLSVRSSAVREDGEYSFAGQYATFLNIRGEDVIQKYKEVAASLFTPKAVFYYKTKGLSEDEIVMAVGVIQMVDARAGGVTYSRDPNNPESGLIITNAVWGLGTTVVDGTASPDCYTSSRNSGEVFSKKVETKQSMFVCMAEGDIREIEVPREMRNSPCLSDGQIKSLSEAAVVLEDLYGKPQDIEWAVGGNGKIYILQSRPLRTFVSHLPAVPTRIEGYRIILDKGVIACKGIGSGKAFVLKDDADLELFPEGSVLIARHTSPKFVTVMNRSSAIVTDIGSATGHMASLSREYRVPTILNTQTATRTIKDGQEITVDAVNCNIYEGKVPELVEYASRTKEPLKETRLFKTLESVLKWIVPLNLIDPDKENFRAEHCQTLHDITRYAHEMAMAEIFKTGKGYEIEGFEDLLSAVAYAEAGEGRKIGELSSALRAGIPVDARLLDIDGGLTTNARRVTPADISSIPFAAFLRGMTSMRWPEPRPADIKGLMEMIAHTASTQEDELRKMGGRSYAIISGNYMNFSIRLGYHFSMVEAYVGDNMNDNYVKFFFKGGGASTDRRLRRVRLIKEILQKLGFKVKVTEDVIDALLAKYDRPATEEVLTVMGKLTAYTKQLDMALFNDPVTDWYIEEFVKEHLKQPAN